MGTRLAELQMIGTSPNSSITHFGFDTRGIRARLGLGLGPVN